jgi:hypothetical protein
MEYSVLGQFPDRARVASIPKQISTELATTLFQETVASQCTTHSPKKQISVAFLGEWFFSQKKRRVHSIFRKLCRRRVLPIFLPIKVYFSKKLN